jgi:glycosyltransferase involved in cell wall biosynthesis
MTAATYSLSVIIPARDSHGSLPPLLESIRRQSLPNIEVILVDDCSENAYDALLAPFMADGMHIRLIRSDKRIYTKEARLLGIDAASSEILMFADADDMLHGVSILEEHVRRFRQSGADILHCNAVDSNADHTEPFIQWLTPFPHELRGRDIFFKFASRFTAFNIWGKLYRRSLWLPLIPIARQSSIQRYCEDLYLFFLYAFHARIYVPSERVGYTYNYRPDSKLTRSLGRMTAVAVLRREFLPWLRENGCPAEALELFAGQLRKHLAMQAGRAALALPKDTAEQEAAFREMLEQNDAALLFDALLTANGIMAELIVDTVIRTTGAVR